MSKDITTPLVKLGFELTSLRIAINDIEMLRPLTPAIRKSLKYGQIAAAVNEVGVNEPPVVFRKPGQPNTYQLLDGHIRIEVMKERGDTEVVCLIATEDEAFTYNKRISRLATVQEHKMIRLAIEKGVPEERLARALNVNIGIIRLKKRLLDGICSEVVTLFQDRQVPINTFREMRRMVPMRQIEVATGMIQMNRFSWAFAKSYVASTPKNLLIAGERKSGKGLTDEQLEKMERESANLDREFKLIEKDYGTDYVDLVLATGYRSRLLNNVRVVHHLAQFTRKFWRSFRKSFVFARPRER
jgi:hypothetical protein